LFQGDLKSDWGFSCFIEDNNTKLLFDTGAYGDILLHNMKRLGINPKDINVVVLSHAHWDHTGGLETMLNIKPDLLVYGPTFSSKPQKLLTNFMTTGTLGKWGIKEQAMIGKTNRGLIVICGCSHPGLENILDIAHRWGDIYGVVGGFHGFGKLDMLQDIQLIVPCHCTHNKQKITALYPDTSSKCGVGKVIEVR
jgi:7,8-dihydropterin-6-yl-methyl-4-(beta-D-ribofuranosyl)aminobenzene 5'-phosphate synthase